MADSADEVQVIAPENKGDLLEDPGQELLDDLENQELEKQNESVPDDLEELDELLDSIEPEDVFGEKLPDKIATTFDRMMKKEFSDSEKEAIKGKLKIPENARVLSVPKVPKVLFRQLPGKAREADVKCQFIQQSISRAMVGAARLTAEVYSTTEKVPTPFKKAVLSACLDIAKNLSIASRDLSIHRRSALKQYFLPEAATICTGAWEPSELLIPEDVEKELKTNKAVCSIVKHTLRGNRFQPYNAAKKTQGGQLFQQQRNSLNFRGFPRNRGGGRGFINRQNSQQAQWTQQGPNPQVKKQ